MKCNERDETEREIPPNEPTGPMGITSQDSRFKIQDSRVKIQDTATLQPLAIPTSSSGLSFL
jgi:hypothetical protein